MLYCVIALPVKLQKPNLNDHSFSKGKRILYFKFNVILYKNSQAYILKYFEKALPLRNKH